MQCEECGTYYSGNGPCPECGSRPGRSHSSLSGWKGDSRSGRGAPAAPNDRRRSSANWGRYDDDYDEPENLPAPARSGNRRRNPADYGTYQDVELSQAIVPTHDDLTPMAQDLTGVPGFPQTEEEERALGIRRPVYIPVTGKKREKKLSSWRVISGVLSVLLVCSASMVLAGIMGQRFITGLMKPPVTVHTTAVPFSTAGVPVTPVATPGPAGKYVQRIVTAQGVNNALFPDHPTSYFTTGSTVYVVFSVRGTKAGSSHTLSVVWYLDGMPLALGPSGQTAKTIHGDSQVFFALKQPTAGVGTAKIYLDKPASDSGTSPGDQFLAGTITFAVTPPQPTPAATSSTTKTPVKITPTATPKK
jgi:hypothetical protein